MNVLPGTRLALFLERRLRPSLPGLIVGASAFCASLTPSLIPRDPLFQGLISGLVASLGYELGNVLYLAYRFLQLPVARPALGRAMRVLTYAVVVAVVTWCMFRDADWQNAVRLVAGVEPVSSSHPLVVFCVSFGVILTLWTIFRLLGILFDRIEGMLARVVPPRVSVLLALGATGWLVWAVTDGVLIQRAFEAADTAFEAADEITLPDMALPQDPDLSGSAQSLVEWDEMGRWGRAFVSRAPQLDELRAFEPEAIRPIRVYVGRGAADTPEGRAAIALAELQRVGAFERAALVIATPVGTGFMDHYAQDTLEFMLGGDVATVGVQYSYLTSALALMVHPDYGLDQSRALFEGVYEYWVTLPEASRPKLYVFGLSQGAYNSQATLPLLDMLAAPISGGVWAGSPFLSPIWQNVRNGRAAGSPAWRPVFGNSSLIRAMNQDGMGPVAGAKWGPMRFVFLQYGSDPIVAFGFPSAFRRPAWMMAPRAPDVAPEFRWFPLVTTLQLALDMATSQKIWRFGHDYAPQDYIDAWAAVFAPEGWSDERAQDLKEIFANRPPAY